MTVSEELAFAKGILEFAPGEECELIVLVTLRGAGFDSWHGIGILTPVRLVLSSAPGVRSSGKALFCRFSEIASFTVQENYASIAFLSQGSLCTLGLSREGKTSENDWNLFIGMLNLRMAGIPNEGEPWPREFIYSLNPIQAGKIQNILADLPRDVQDHPHARLWRAFSLLWQGSFEEALRLLKMPGPGFENQRLGLLGICFLLLHEPENAESCFAILSASSAVPRWKILLLISHLIQGKWNPGETVFPGAPKAGTGILGEKRDPRFSRIVETYGFSRIFRLNEMTDVYKFSGDFFGELLCAWSDLATEDVASVQKFIERAPGFPGGDPFEVLRLEAALAQAIGNPEKAFFMMLNAASGELLHPFLDCALELGLEEKAFPSLQPLLSESLPQAVLVRFVGILVGVGKHSQAMELLETLSGNSPPFSWIERLWLGLWKSRSLEKLGKRAEAWAELELLFSRLNKGFSRIESFQSDGFPLTAYWEIWAKAHLLGAGMNIAEGAPEKALWRLGITERYWKHRSLPHEAQQARKWIETAQNLLESSAPNAEYPENPDPPLEERLSRNFRVIHQFRDVLEGFSGPLKRHPVFSRILEECRVLFEGSNSPLTVVVLGEVKSGKSTLLNAWFGRELLPTGVLATSSVPYLLRYGLKPLARIISANGSVKAVPISDIRKQVIESPGGLIDLVELFLQEPVLNEVWMVDTPGLNSRVLAHGQATESFLRNADAFIWVFDATQSGRASEIEAFRRLIPGGAKVILVLNRIDEVNTQEIPDLEREVRKIVNRDDLEIIPFSAYQAFLAHRNNLPSGYEKSGFDRLSHCLNQEFFSRVGEAKLASLEMKLNSLFRKIDFLKNQEWQKFEGLRARLNTSMEGVSVSLSDWNSQRRHAWVEKFFQEVSRERARLEAFSGDFAVDGNGAAFRDLFHRVLDRKIEEFSRDFANWGNDLLNQLFPLWREIQGVLDIHYPVSAIARFMWLLEAGLNDFSAMMRQIGKEAIGDFFVRPETRGAGDAGERLKLVFRRMSDRAVLWNLNFEKILFVCSRFVDDLLWSEWATLKFTAFEPLLRMQRGRARIG